MKYSQLNTKNYVILSYVALYIAVHKPAGSRSATLELWGYYLMSRPARYRIGKLATKAWGKDPTDIGRL